MIDTLEIRSFKSILDTEIALGQINVFIGANGSGKSNILEAIGVLGAAAFGRVDDESLLRRGVRPGVPALYKSSFRGEHTRKLITLIAKSGSNASAAHYSAGLWNPIHTPQPAWKYHTESWGEVARPIVGRSPASKAELDPFAGEAALRLVTENPASQAAILLRALQEYAVYSPNTSTLRGLVPDYQQREPVGLSGGRLPEAVADILQFYNDKNAPYRQMMLQALSLIDWASSIGCVPPSSTQLSPSVPTGRYILRFGDKYMAEKRNTLTGYDASEGALYVLFDVVMGAHPGAPGFFAIDNFDHGLNPRLSMALVARFCEWVLSAPRQRQVLLTTHNPLALDGLDLQNDKVRLFTVDRTSKSGQTVVKRIQIDETIVRLSKEKKMPLSRLWVTGELGGVPNVW